MLSAVAMTYSAKLDWPKNADRIGVPLRRTGVEPSVRAPELLSV